MASKKGTKKVVKQVEEKTKILFVASECANFAVTGGLADVAGSLPKAIMNANSKYEVKVVLPLYKKIVEKYFDKLKYVTNTNVVLAWRNVYCGIFSMTYNGVDYYFIDNKQYFDRDGLYGYYDDGERFAFYSKSIFKLIEITGFYPNVIHTNDWHTALVNIYLDILYKRQGIYMNIKSIFTIHNIEYQGVYGLDFLSDVIGIDKKYQNILEFNGNINLIKGAIVCSDLVSTVSPNYAKEITTPEYGHGLENILNDNSNKLIGIINGIDYEAYNPKTNKDLYANYDEINIENKFICKEKLQEELGLPVNKDICMISMISRLVSHKGIDLVIDIIWKMMDLDIQLVILGTGDKYYEDKLKELAWKYPNKMRALIQFNGALSKKIYSASDLFLMPSKTEPCGLSQMIASRYGSVAIVRATGGLYDSIKDQSNLGCGFVFNNFDSNEMLNKIKEAVEIYYKKEEFDVIRSRAITTDFSWNNSAKQYIEYYEKIK